MSLREQRESELQRIFFDLNHQTQEAALRQLYNVLILQRVTGNVEEIRRIEWAILVVAQFHNEQRSDECMLEYHERLERELIVQRNQLISQQNFIWQDLDLIYIQLRALQQTGDIFLN